MRLDPETYESINHDVYEFLADWGITQYPIDPFKLLEMLGVKLVPYERLEQKAREAAFYQSEDAVLVAGSYYDLSQLAIAYDNINSKERIRYSLSHEIGHIIREHTGENSDREESEAQFFAGYLLAPLPLVIQYCPTMDIQDIMDTFIISHESASIVIDHAAKRWNYGGPWKDYEYAIVKMCTVKGKEKKPPIKI